jgi:hypothetical protein
LRLLKLFCPEIGVGDKAWGRSGWPTNRIDVFYSFCPYFIWVYLLQEWKEQDLARIQINQPTRCNNFASLLLDVYVWLNMFRAPLRPSSGAYNCTRSLWFYRWSGVVGALLFVVWSGQTTTNNAPTVKPEAHSAVVRSWWWAERRPKHVEPHINIK